VFEEVSIFVDITGGFMTGGTTGVVIGITGGVIMGTLIFGFIVLLLSMLRFGAGESVGCTGAESIGAGAGSS
jgi:hypothetical protein